MATDARVDWFRPRVCTLLGLPEAKGKALWDGLISDEAALKSFKTFLSGDAGGTNAPSLMLFVDPGVAPRRTADPAEASENGLIPAVPQPTAAPADSSAAAQAEASDTAADAGTAPAAVASQKENAQQASESLLVRANPKLRLCAGAFPKEEVQGRPAAYFTRDCAPPGELKFDDLPVLISSGLLSGGTPSLLLLDQVLKQVYLPLLTQQSPGGKAARPGQLTAKASAEVAATLDRFSTHVKHMIHAQQGDVKLQIPDLDLSDPAAAAKDPELVEQLERTLASWTEVMDALLQREISKKVQAPGAMAEITYWRERNALVGAVHEQLLRHNAQSIIDVGCTASEDPKLVSNFRAAAASLKQLTEEARGNLKFLATLERHFEVLQSGALNAVCDCLPSLMSALRMVWIISRHYGDDATMFALLKRIAAQIADRIEAAVKPKELFGMPLKESTELLNTAATLAKQWFNIYMQIREQIEVGGKDSRWEFNKPALFERTNHIAAVCTDLAAFAATVNDFRSFLGPALRSITGDVQAIDEVVMMVDDLSAVITHANFNVMSHSHPEEWEAVKKDFKELKEEVAGATQSLIDKSFRRLRSAEAATQLLLSMKRMETGGALQAQMMAKSTEIVAQFARELDSVSNLFRSKKASPPVARDVPPVAGAIQWSRSLMARCQRTMNAIESLQPSLLQTPFGSTVHGQYRSLARNLLNFEKGWYDPWHKDCDAQVTSLLMQPLLSEDPTTDRVIVLFPIALRVAMREARMLDRLGLAVPPAATTLALQESHYMAMSESLESMLRSYYQAVDGLSPIEADLLHGKIRELRKSLLPGFDRLNWTALGISEFISATHKAVGLFQSVVTQVRKSANLALQAQAAIEQAHLCPELCRPLAPEDVSTHDVDVPTLHALCDDIEVHHQQVVKGLLAQYASISPALIAIEEQVYGTATGKHPEMAPFYRFWEASIFRAINAMVLRGINDLLAAAGKKGRRAKELNERRAPLFKTSLGLVGGEIVSAPTSQEVEKSLAKAARGLVECTKHFVRWMHGTCLICPPIKVSEDADVEPFIHSFFADVGASPTVVKAVLTLSQHAHRAISLANRCMESWRKHQALWKLDKSAVIDKLAAKTPTTAVWNARLGQYLRAAQSFHSQKRTMDSDFVRVDASALADAAMDEALTWLQLLSHAMRRIDQPDVQATSAWLKQVTVDLNGDASSATTAVRAVQEQSAANECRMADMQQRCRLRLSYIEAAGKFGDRRRSSSNSGLLLETELSPSHASRSKLRLLKITVAAILHAAVYTLEVKDEQLTWSRPIKGLAAPNSQPDGMLLDLEMRLPLEHYILPRLSADAAGEFSASRNFVDGEDFSFSSDCTKFAIFAPVSSFRSEICVYDANTLNRILRREYWDATSGHTWSHDGQSLVILVGYFRGSPREEMECQGI
ncbi:hypothetical protein WJX73_008170 [Symbiochloris irregularis]|uniref:Dynein heavy chain tail domain-containing protein n=1 Tax=Symbiochloris irregularis TaxID=706552 RepID=A0AAW1PVR5_9CHLO